MNVGFGEVWQRVKGGRKGDARRDAASMDTTAMWRRDASVEIGKTWIPLPPRVIVPAAVLALRAQG
uniref:Uncharacterized protein n=1 Tax=Oryza glumipatula TaxID=40148 RepID=A0A0D9Y7M0_9ORYZ